MECRILKSPPTKHIDRWQLDFDVDKDLKRDSDRPWLPENALSYLRSNYPAEVMEEILAQVAVSIDRVRERWQDHNESFQESGFAKVDSSRYVLGRSVHQFAPAIAALNDGEEMVNMWHGLA